MVNFTTPIPGNLDYISSLFEFPLFIDVFLISSLFTVIAPLFIGAVLLQNSYKEARRNKFKTMLAHKINSDPSGVEKRLSGEIVTYILNIGDENKLRLADLPTAEFAQDFIADIYFKKRLFYILKDDLVQNNISINEFEFKEVMNSVENWKSNYTELESDTNNYLNVLIERDNSFIIVKKFISSKSNYYKEKQWEFADSVKEVLKYTLRRHVSEKEVQQTD